jgi:hypothetical protein
MTPNKLLNKKAQFGPDYLMAIIIVIIVGLGGVLFLQFFVSGLTMQGLLSILDTESDQRCFGILAAMVGDEYVPTGDDVTGMPFFQNLRDYYSATISSANRSIRFENKMIDYESKITHANFNPGRVVDMEYFLTSRSNSNLFDSNVMDILRVRDQNITSYISCSMQVFGIRESGVAKIYMKIIS